MQQKIEEIVSDKNKGVSFNGLKQFAGPPKADNS